MKSVLNERFDFQRKIIDYLTEENGYIERKASSFDPKFAMDKEVLFDFLEKTQKETMDELRRVYKDDLEETLVEYINKRITQDRGSLIQVLKHGLEISNRKIDLIYTRPATDYNKDLVKKYQSNIFSVMEEVVPKKGERVDLVIFLNGFAIMTFELKSNPSGQSYEDAMKQYMEDRDPKSRLFLWKAGSIVNFAMDTNEVYMTTKLDREKTYFLPFNKGRGKGIESGAGNPIVEGKLPVAYMWEDILTKDSILELINKFIFLERKVKKNQETGKKTVKETLIFPRYHQLDLIRKLIADIKVNKTSQNYLIQHSAGSGKTNSIAWLAHRLVSLHDEDNKVIYDSIIIITDRVVVDRQLQKAVMQIDHKLGLIEVLDKDKSSHDLKLALERGSKIIATTIQKFPYILDEIKKMEDRSFAVIIDEAHSSTSGRNMKAVTEALASGEEDYEDSVDYITRELSKNGKQDNISMFAFTATPKATTLKMFGRLNKKGQYEAFHLYSMKQAIEEKFILDVLTNYTTYKTLYHLNKEIEEDPELKTTKAKRQIARFVELHDTNISQRVEVIIEHFRGNVMERLNGQAKAMVITSSRQAAVKYKKAFEDYITRKDYKGINTLVAFSGKVKLEDDPETYTEYGMNGIKEEALPDRFDEPFYNVLIVANKYQTGFDQNKLSAMYIMKKLRGVNAVQTLSRLNRTCGKDKQVFVLDFANDYEDIKNAFAPYYSATFLANDLDPRQIYNLEKDIRGYYIIDPLDVRKFYDLIFKSKSKRITSYEKESLLTLLNRSARLLKNNYSNKDQREFLGKIKSFKRFYEFLIQVSRFKDPDIERLYVFTSYLLDMVNIGESGTGFDLTGKIRAENFYQKKDKVHKDEKKPAKPMVKLPNADSMDLPDDKKEKLSEIINDINSKTGKDFNVDLASKAAMQIKDIMMKSDKLKTSAKTNTESDFMFSYFSEVENALLDGLNQNEEFFSLLINNQDMQKDVLGIFAGEIYKSLKNAPSN